jgi:hypothetical protein
MWLEHIQQPQCKLLRTHRSFGGRSGWERQLCGHSQRCRSQRSCNRLQRRFPISCRRSRNVGLLNSGALTLSYCECAQNYVYVQNTKMYWIAKINSLYAVTSGEFLNDVQCYIKGRSWGCCYKGLNKSFIVCILHVICLKVVQCVNTPGIKARNSGRKKSPYRNILCILSFL